MKTDSLKTKEIPMKNVYLFAAILGTVIPYVFFGSFFFEYGVNLIEFVTLLFANSPASGFTSDLLITSSVFWLWSFGEARAKGMRNWWLYVVLNLTVGLSCSLPLFLYFRQCKIDLGELQEAKGRDAESPFGNLSANTSTAVLRS